MSEFGLKKLSNVIFHVIGKNEIDGKLNIYNGYLSHLRICLAKQTYSFINSHSDIMALNVNVGEKEFENRSYSCEIVTAKFSQIGYSSRGKKCMGPDSL